MQHELPILINITVALLAAFVGGFLARCLKLPSMVGYMLAGVAIGPFTPGFIGDLSTIQQLAELGVIFLLFDVGLHFSLRDLWAVRDTVIPAAGSPVGMVARCWHPPRSSSDHCQYRGHDPQFDGSGAAQYFARTGCCRLAGAGRFDRGPHSRAAPGALHDHTRATLANGRAGPVENRGVCRADVSCRNADYSLVPAAHGALSLSGTLHCRDCCDYCRDSDWRLVSLWCFPGARRLSGRGSGERIGTQPPSRGRDGPIPGNICCPVLRVSRDAGQSLVFALPCRRGALARRGHRPGQICADCPARGALSSTGTHSADPGRRAQSDWGILLHTWHGRYRIGSVQGGAVCAAAGRRAALHHAQPVPVPSTPLDRSILAESSRLLVAPGPTWSCSGLNSGVIARSCRGHRLRTSRTAFGACAGPSRYSAPGGRTRYWASHGTGTSRSSYALWRRCQFGHPFTGPPEAGSCGGRDAAG